ncbi:MAG: asparagine synthase (glutamine-hydrolyzing) [Proteobacteria bacterium]|nr:asparagine synthase (glutamine-hydrolyzing) [Pseudomonadota bacterium]
MCGLAGIVDWNGRQAPGAVRAAVMAMTDRLAHRGPDDTGLWSDGIATLGQRRLAVIDLSAAGHQPMLTPDGRYAIVYNGEIYNHLEMAAELAATGFQPLGHSDTEILLGAIAAYGLEGALERAAGMFALALWDGERREMTLARDRLGKKPLYWTSAGGRLAFASELTALMGLDTTPRRIDEDALVLYLRHGAVPAPRTILAGVHKLEPGTALVFAAHDRADERRYWDLREIAIDGAMEPFEGSAQEADDRLEALLDTAVRQRMIADVPLGIFVSGGIDSSLIAALMARASSRPVKSFTIAFDEDGWDEGPHARAVAGHLGLEHRELRVDPAGVPAMAETVAGLFDEPFADASMVPTWLVSRMAREEVTVAVGGDGGDELFAGYSRYPWVLDTWSRLRPWPRPLRTLGAGLLQRAPLGGDLGRKLHHYGAMVDATGTDDLYRRTISACKDPARIARRGREPRGLIWDATLRSDLSDPLARLQLMDGATFLPDTILTKVDRASMAVSLEVRAPLLDHRVAEFAFSLPRSMLLAGGQGKLPLRRLLDRHVPPELTHRPKQGFSPPVGAWLRGPLRGWAGELLARRRIEESGLLDAGAVETLWQQHQSGGWHHANALWAIAMFEHWRGKHLA